MSKQLALLTAMFLAAPLAAQQPDRLETLKQEAVADIDRRATFTQQLVDQLFSFGELGFQETETSRTLIALLRKNGFAVEEGVAGMPTAWVATWGSGKPVIMLGSDLDGIPKASQRPGVACHSPLVPGAPGHGEGHNSGQAVNITAVLAVKRLMEREHLPGTIKLWPGVAEELLAGKAYLVRAGVFRDADAVLFSHVGDNFDTSWGEASGTGLVSVLYSFRGKAAHAAGAPWVGRSALDAAELMDIGWNFRREHLRLAQRSHSVIRDGGDQPNVVPSNATTWYYLRELDYDHIRSLWAVADSVAAGAALMTGTTLLPTRVVGSAWPRYFDRPIAEAMESNIRRVGLPSWSEADQQLARAVQREVQGDTTGLPITLDSIQGPVENNQGGPSDDIGDVAWNVPTAILYYPANIPNLPGHHWADAIAMATPIAHKGSTAGAKVMAMTVLDLLLRPALVDSAATWFREVQTKDVKYQPLIRPEDLPATEFNQATMARFRDQMRKFYYDPTRFPNYLAQLGITYPTLRAGAGNLCATGSDAQ
jgi:aminobenzoyl-glutamate utilization protein B